MARNSQSLFNFMKELDFLKQALERGSFWPRYSKETHGWLAATARTPSQVAFPMVCFCDIPLQRISEHVATYGRCGLGMSRSWGIRAGLNPVFYVSRHSEVSRVLAHMVRSGVSSSLDDLVEFAKPLPATPSAPAATDVYSESEWRYVPRDPNIKRRVYGPPPHIPNPETHLDADIARENLMTEQFGRLKFELSDVRYIFVPTDNDIPGMVDFIESSPALQVHPKPSLQLLSTKLTSLETLLIDS